MIGKVNVGGGGGLNLTVVCSSSAPSSPKANTIWINSATNYAAWTIANAAPTSPANGDVWICTGAVSAVSVSVDRKNTLIIYPVGAYQYNSTSAAWELKAAQVYLNGAWVNLQTYFYQDGVISALAGDFTNVGSVTVTKYSTYMTLKGTYASGWCHAASANKIDVTNLNHIYFDMMASTSSGSAVGLKSVRSEAAMDYPSPSAVETTRGTVSLDVTGITGSYYLFFRIYQTRTYTVYNIWAD